MFASAHAAVAGQAPQAGAENGGRPTIVATCLADGESIALDGRLDEPVWSRAVPGGDFMQVDPDNGRPATEKTEDRMTIGTIKVSPAWRARFLASSVFNLRGSGDRDNTLVERTRAALNR